MRAHTNLERTTNVSRVFSDFIGVADWKAASNSFRI